MQINSEKINRSRGRVQSCGYEGKNIQYIPEKSKIEGIYSWCEHCFSSFPVM